VRLDKLEVARARAAGLCPPGIKVTDYGSVTFAQDGTAYVEAVIEVPPPEPCPTCGQETPYNEKEK
jgi:hypothetical protein